MCLLLCLWMAFSTTVSAHTGLQSSYPTEGEMVEGEVKEITMEFNTSIEKGSLFTLFDEKGTEIALEDIQIDKNKLIGTTSESLTEGLYTVNWSIVGEDGHLIKGEYTFTVAQKLGNKAEGQSSVVDEAKEEVATIDKAEKEVNQSSVADKEEQSKTNPSIVISIITGFLLFAAVQTAVWLIRRGKK
ncbi:copper resistance CopC family protein [Bacillus sp. FJAT-42315]|uniref:copper resistance CopC family protein n=1 Tax=Bacillus sp. FJAT-42315 TaxID=2014077 RepID=UPI000C233EC5|nr:copper resistance protein CopC [Bacillus sp. FJAT-42315]